MGVVFLSPAVGRRRVLWLSLFAVALILVTGVWGRACHKKLTCATCLRQSGHSCVWRVDDDNPKTVGSCRPSRTLGDDKGELSLTEDVKEAWKKYLKVGVPGWDSVQLHPNPEQLARYLAEKIDAHHLTFPHDSRPFLTIPRTTWSWDHFGFERSEQADRLCRGDLLSDDTFTLRPAYACVRALWSGKISDMHTKFADPYFLQSMFFNMHSSLESRSKKTLAKILLHQAKTSSRRRSAAVDRQVANLVLLAYRDKVFGESKKHKYDDIRKLMLDLVAFDTVNAVNAGACLQKKKSLIGKLVDMVRAGAKKKSKEFDGKTYGELPVGPDVDDERAEPSAHVSDNASPHVSDDASLVSDDASHVSDDDSRVSDDVTESEHVKVDEKTALLSSKGSDTWEGELSF